MGHNSRGYQASRPNKLGSIGGFVVIALLGLLIAGCGEDKAAERSLIATAPGLLPTPTLALPGNVDPLKPPTPIILPSPAPPGGALPETVAEAHSASAESTPVPTPTDVPLPEGATPRELLEFGRTSAAEGNQVTAAAAFRAVLQEPGDLISDELTEAHLGLGVALMAEGQNAAAERELAALVESAPSRGAIAKGDPLPGSMTAADIASFHLGQVRLALGDYEGAIDAFTAYLSNNSDMAAYVQPLIADAYEASGDAAAGDRVIAALEAAADAPAQRFRAVANRMRLAALYIEREDYPAAVIQYDAIRDIARTEATKGQMSYLAGQAELLAGNTEAGHERLLFGVINYPRAVESYHGLIALLDADVPVDEYQRGVVDYYAGAYLPALEAFGRYVAGPGDDFNADAYLFTAWSHEALGNSEVALAAVKDYAKYEPVRALFERGEILRRAGQVNEALAAYDTFLADPSDADNAAAVAWTAATLADSAGLAGAAKRYLFLADTFPFDGNTPSALSRAAELLEDDDPGQALALRQRLVEQYPANIYGAEALFRMLQEAGSSDNDTLDEATLVRQLGTLSLSNYFALRATDFAADVPPFSAKNDIALPDDPEAGRAEAEVWLSEQLTAVGETVPDGELGGLSDELAADPQRIVGEKLWQLGMLEEAKAELEAVRESYAGSALANYQMARYFSRLGLFRSSIIAAASMLNQIGATVYDAPIYLGRLSFPVYYADLIMPLAGRYGYDPRLQFALVRQESLFESFARSGAAAQGLSQVIPDTGAWIAQRLAWPDFENEDLYKPYVGLNFGAYYLSQQLEMFDGHIAAALAAYNAGPGNAARWFATAGDDHDRFVDTVDFPETRLYIERIYEGFNAYRHLYDRP